MHHFVLLIGAFPVESGVFGDDTVSSVLFSVQCTGNEAEIMDCAHSKNGLETCSHHSSAVICQGILCITRSLVSASLTHLKYEWEQSGAK